MARSKITNSWTGPLSVFGQILKIALDEPLEITRSEHKLLIGVLDRAFRDLTLSDQSIRNRARNYFLSDEYSDEIMSFHWVCHQLGTDPEKFRHEMIIRKLLD